MGWTKTVTIWCDGCGMGEQTSVPTVGEARDRVDDIGWIYRDGEDMCPDCQEEDD